MKFIPILLTTFLWTNFSKAQFLDVNQFNSDSHQDKILIFLSNHCPCSVSHEDHLNYLARQFKRIHFYGVLSEPLANNDNKVIKHFTEKKFNFPIVRDDQQNLVNKYKALKTPHVTWLRKVNEKYEVIYQGGVSDKSDFTKSSVHFLEENLNRAIKGETMKYSYGRSLGCYIKRYN
ncbi:MAG: redoxin domain-containing protein [Bdellovibrionales bacterium]|nr:redoxin domain-containing protein [Bdellovibrionales bacterium]